MKSSGFAEMPEVWQVTPYAGVWIEILNNAGNGNADFVTPYAGVWIEISSLLLSQKKPMVTPYAGVWIEIAI